MSSKVNAETPSTSSSSAKFTFATTTLYVKDVVKTIEFYEKVFGFKRRFIHEDQYGELDTGATSLSFASHSMMNEHGTKQPISLTGNAHPPAQHIALTTDNVQEAYAHVTKNGCDGLLPPEEKFWGQSVSYVRDPNGFIIEISSHMKSAPGTET